MRKKGITMYTFDLRKIGKRDQKDRSLLFNSENLKTLTILLVLIQIPFVPLAFSGEHKAPSPNAEYKAIINLDGIEPADQIVQRNGTIEIGSTNVVNAALNTLIEQGLATPKDTMVDSYLKTMNPLEIQSIEAGEKSARPDEASLPHKMDTAIDQVFENIEMDTTSKSSNFRPRALIQNSGAVEMGSSNIVNAALITLIEQGLVSSTNGKMEFQGNVDSHLKDLGLAPLQNVDAGSSRLSSQLQSAITKVGQSIGSSGGRAFKPNSPIVNNGVQDVGIYLPNTQVAPPIDIIQSVSPTINQAGVWQSPTNPIQNIRSTTAASATQSRTFPGGTEGVGSGTRRFGQR